MATFTPSDLTVYQVSTSGDVLVQAQAPLWTPATGSVDVGIPAGTLTITTPYTGGANTFHLGNAVLDSSGSFFTASASFGSSGGLGHGVTITDTRAGQFGWSATAVSTPFVNGTNKISAENLAFTGVAPTYLTGNALQLGSVTPHDVTSTFGGGTGYAANATGTDGLGAPHAFATAGAGNSDGSVYIDGLLTLRAPSSTPQGTYTATFTLTIA